MLPPETPADENPYAAPQASLREPAAPKFSAINFNLVAWRTNLFFSGLKYGAIAGGMVCVLLIFLFLAESNKTLSLVGLLVFYCLMTLGFFALWGTIAGAVLMVLDFMLQVIGFRSPPEQMRAEKIQSFTFITPAASPREQFDEQGFPSPRNLL